ncbi:MAG TPA: CU044_2847 family protein [Polyangiaceae bacterium]|nr:CU044_2847 family protein [Polyangiaceae bacterium]
MADAGEPGRAASTETVWVQVDARATDDPLGRTVKVGRSEERVSRAIATLGDQFRQSMASAIEINARAVRDAAARLEQPPKELELTFGLALLAEGNFAVTKMSGDANFSVRMVWRDEPASK